MNIIDVDCRLIKSFLPERKFSANKGDFGQSVIIGGSSFYVGAPEFCAESASVVSKLLPDNTLQNSDSKRGNSYNENNFYTPKNIVECGESAMLSGSGTSVLAVPEFLAEKIYADVKYSAIYPLSFKTDDKNPHIKSIKFVEKEIAELMKRGTAFAVGPGAAVGETDKIVSYILKKGKQNFVVDADALFPCRNFNFENRAVLTPHIGELAAMCGLPRVNIVEKQADSCLIYAVMHSATVVLKSDITYISDGENVYRNTFGNVKLAKGGSGDVLSGIICGLIAAGLTPIKAAVSGCYVLGRAAELSAVNAYSHLPTDIIKIIPSVFDEILNTEK